MTGSIISTHPLPGTAKLFQFGPERAGRPGGGRRRRVCTMFSGAMGSCAGIRVSRRGVPAHPGLDHRSRDPRGESATVISVRLATRPAARRRRGRPPTGRQRDQGQQNQALVFSPSNWNVATEGGHRGRRRRGQHRRRRPIPLRASPDCLRRRVSVIAVDDDRATGSPRAQDHPPAERPT